MSGYSFTDVDADTEGRDHVRLTFRGPGGDVIWGVVSRSELASLIAKAKQADPPAKTRVQLGSRTSTGDPLVVAISGRDAVEVFSRALALSDKLRGGVS